MIFPANASAIDSAEYLLIPQSAAGSPGVSSSFLLVGDTVHTPVAALMASLATQSPAQQFHDFLRQGERLRWYGFAPQAGAGPAVPSALLLAGPPTVGSSRTFSLCAKLDCSSFKTVTATAKVVQGHIALYVDNLAPTANGLVQADFDTLAATFNIDNNTVVIVLMTNAVNQLVSAAQCNSSGFVAGFFFAADIDPQFARDNRVNHGEIFYSLVADSAGTLSCPHTRLEVTRLAPVTFVHEFQHMISFNRHVLVAGAGGQAEVLWLNEGMSHFAEELGGRSYLPGTAADSATFTRFVIGDLYNAYQYLDATGSHYLLANAGIGTLAERGAMWMFVRYITDGFRADTSFAATAAFTRKLEDSTRTGADNVMYQTGVGFDTLVARWALANWVSDLPGFTPPPELTYTSWNFRTTYASLNTSRPASFPKPFPLVPTASAGDLTNVAGTLLAGSGVYHRALQAPLAAGFQLQFGDGAGNYLPANIVPRLTIIRIR